LALADLPQDPAIDFNGLAFNDKGRLDGRPQVMTDANLTFIPKQYGTAASLWPKAE
jgi:hypothetical protein